MRKPVDIIVPIYNAYDELTLCVESIKRHTDFSLDRLILINDASTDERIAGYLQGLAADNIVVINNEKNEGFSNNVNKGMSYSDSTDVLLLNSDTVVTKNWVDKIVKCAYSAEEIATVTPLSNSATLCSVPLMCQDNDIPQNVTIDEFADLIENCSLKRYPRITVAVGFCMFIKRNVIEDVGLFDAESFKKGYGEENDFCNRAEQLGYIHVMCDDTFIYHKGTVSFVSEEKQRLIEAHDKILNERYPAQIEKNHIYCTTNPDQYIRDIINVYLHIANKKENLLYLLHLDFRSDAEGSVGGTQFHVRDLTYGMLSNYNVFVVARDGEYIRLTIYTDKTRDSFKFYVGKKGTYFQFTNAQYKKIFGTVLDAFHIDKVHIHHVDGLSFDMFYEAKDRNIPLFLTMHDYFYVCPVVKLLNGSNYCGGEINPPVCRGCLEEKYGIAPTVDYNKKWRTKCREVLNLVDKIIVPSEAAKNVVVGVYADVADKLQVIEHGSCIEAKIETGPMSAAVSDDVEMLLDRVEYVGNNISVVTGWAILKNADNNNVKLFACVEDGRKKQYYEVKKHSRQDIGRYYGSEKYTCAGINFKFFNLAGMQNPKVSFILEYCGKYYTNGYTVALNPYEKKEVNDKKKIAFLGEMLPAKGSELVYRIIKAAPVDKYDFYVLGDIGYEPLSELVCDNLVKLGKYDVRDLPFFVSNLCIDLICILPVWPETFCYTLSEAILCDVPVLGTDIGAVGERIKEHGYGWTVDYRSTPDEILKKIGEIFRDTADYDAKRKVAVDFKETTLEDMIKNYKCLYASVEKSPKYRDFCRSYIAENLYIDGKPCIHDETFEERRLKDVNRYQADVIEQNRQTVTELRNIKASRSYRLMYKILKLIGRR